MTTPDPAAEWLARTLHKADPFITVGIQDSGAVRVGYGKGAYIITIHEEDDALPDRESYEETIEVLSDPEAMEAIREGQEGDSDEFRSVPQPAEPRHYIALVGGARAYTKLTPVGPVAFPKHAPGDPIEIAGDNKWYPVSEEIALEWTRDDESEEGWDDDV
jgi:hypothetical protein